MTNLPAVDPILDQQATTRLLLFKNGMDGLGETLASLFIMYSARLPRDRWPELCVSSRSLHAHIGQKTAGVERTLWEIEPDIVGPAFEAAVTFARKHGHDADIVTDHLKDKLWWCEVAPGDDEPSLHQARKKVVEGRLTIGEYLRLLRQAVDDRIRYIAPETLEPMKRRGLIGKTNVQHWVDDFGPAKAISRPYYRMDDKDF